MMTVLVLVHLEWNGAESKVGVMLLCNCFFLFWRGGAGLPHAAFGIKSFPLAQQVPVSSHGEPGHAKGHEHGGPQMLL